MFNPTKYKIINEQRTQENKDRIDWTFFHLVLSTPPDQKKLKILLTRYRPSCGSHVQIGQFCVRIGYSPEWKSALI